MPDPARIPLSSQSTSGLAQTNAPDYTTRLRSLMAAAELQSYRALSLQSGVSERQILRLRQGKAEQMRLESLVRLANTLRCPISQFLQEFSSLQLSPKSEPGADLDEELNEGKILPAPLESVSRQEYERLQTQFQQQQSDLATEFQRAALYTLETWMTFWPTAVAKVEEDAQFPASRLLPLVRPVEQLLEQWDVEAIATVGTEVAYDPTQHQLMGGTAEPGQAVRVRNVGYRHQGKLLHRAKVSPV